MIANYWTSGAGRDPYLRQEGGRLSRERNEKRKSYEIANELYCGARAAVRLRILKRILFFFSILPIQRKERAQSRDFVFRSVYFPSFRGLTWTARSIFIFHIETETSNLGR